MASQLSVSCLALATLLLAASAVDASGKGYEYQGKVDFVTSPAKPGLAKLRLNQDAQPTAAVPMEQLHTVLIHRDGSKFTKRLDLSEAAAAKAQATQLRASPPPAGSPASPSGRAGGVTASNATASSRRLLQSGTHHIQVAATDSDLSCQGCPTTDSRVQITATTTYPYSAVGELIGELGTTDEGLQCSGTLLGRSHVLTAAHCVFDINDSLQYVSSLDVMPGLSGGTAPYGTLEWKSVRVLSTFTSQTSYTPTAMDNDFALITLADEAPEACGYFGLYQPPSTGSVTVDITTAGYPGDKASGTMWQSTCSDVTILATGTGFLASLSDCTSGGCDNIIRHTCLSSDGQSGSGMWDANHLQHAILTGKVETSADVGYNVGTGIDVSVYNTLVTWYNEDGGNLPTTPAVGTGGSTKSSGISIKTPWVIAVIAAGGAVVLLILMGIILACCCRSRSYPAKASPSADYPQGAYTGGQGYPQGGYQGYPQQQGGQWGGPVDNGLPPHNGGYPAGVAYDDRSNSFMVNGQHSGQYRQ